MHNPVVKNGRSVCHCEAPALAVARGFRENDLPPIVILSEAKDLGAEGPPLVIGRLPRRGASLRYASFCMTDKGCHWQEGAVRLFHRKRVSLRSLR
jgi:hypothetical protein